MTTIQERILAAQKMDEPKICFVCKHFQNDLTKKCRRLVRSEGVDLVSGTIHFSGLVLDCHAERTSGLSCGPEGHYFEPVERTIKEQ